MKEEEKEKKAKKRIAADTFGMVSDGLFLIGEFLRSGRHD